jgi:hypothetical protein
MLMRRSRRIASATWHLGLLLACTISSRTLLAQATPHGPERDRQTLETLEHEWLETHDSTTLDRILAPDFVHPVSGGLVLTKAQHIAWAVTHVPPPGITRRFEQMRVRLYGDVGIVNGIVVATQGGHETARTLFTDVFVYRDGRWQAVNAQETPAPTRPATHSP